MIWLMEILAGIILLVCLGFIAYWAVALIKGDCRFRMIKSRMTPFKVAAMDMNSVTLSYTIPIKNTGRQLGTIMDAFVRTYLPFEQYDHARVSAHLTDKDLPRDDDYWQASIVEPGTMKTFLVTLVITGKHGNILRDLDDFPDMPMDIMYQIVGRSDYYYAKTRIILTRDELQSAVYQYTQEAGR